MKKDNNYIAVKDLKENDPIIVIESYKANNHYNIYDCKVKSFKFNKDFEYKIEVEPNNEDSILYSNFRSEIIVKDPKDRYYLIHDYIEDEYRLSDFPNVVDLFYCFSRKSSIEILNNIIDYQNHHYKTNINRHKLEIKELKRYQKIDKVKNNKSKSIINKLFSNKDC